MSNYIRTTPKQGTSDRFTLEGLNENRNKILDEQLDARCKLRGEIERTRPGTKKADNLRFRLEKMEAQHRLFNENANYEFIQQQVRKAFLEDVVDQGDEANHLAALIELKHPMTGASDRIKELATACAQRHGVTDPERLRLTTGSVTNMIQSFPSIKETLEIRTANDIKVENRRDKERAVRNELNDLNLTQQERQYYANRIDFYADDPSNGVHMTEAREVSARRNKQKEEDRLSDIQANRRKWESYKHNADYKPERITRVAGAIGILKANNDGRYDFLRSAVASGWASNGKWAFLVKDGDKPLFEKAVDPKSERSMIPAHFFSDLANVECEEVPVRLVGFAKRDEEWLARLDSESGWTVTVPAEDWFMLTNYHSNAIPLIPKKGCWAKEPDKILFKVAGKLVATTMALEHVRTVFAQEPEAVAV